MTRLKTAILALAFAGVVGGQAHAADANADSYAAMGFYLRGDIGWSFLEWSGKDDSGLALGGGVGYRFNDNLRADVRVDWAGVYDSTVGGNDMQITTGLANLYFDIPTNSMITPYLGAGVGYGWGTVDGPNNNKDGAAYALMAGASISLTDNIDMDVGYRFREVMSDGNNPMEHQITTGLRFGF
ncbi:MAG: porin family protein [Alphaproteobacteria bacterium]|nr:porin family protein [Alphaproteobacteria bacterium]